jgi:hypothetical protein
MEREIEAKEKAEIGDEWRELMGEQDASVLRGVITV